jgi:DMSO/TMAO reductase YedYZ molybdopterin-dependent catalytic subunit
MNGRDLPIPHGGPLRLRLERQHGYKSLKFVQRLVVSDRFDDGGQSGSIQNGWAWYTRI